MPRFAARAHSLFGEILDWVLAPLLLLWPISLALTWLVAQELAARPFDRALAHNAQVLAQFIEAGQGRPLRFSLPQPVGELLRSEAGDLVYYQVLDETGALLSLEGAAFGSLHDPSRPLLLLSALDGSLLEDGNTPPALD